MSKATAARTRAWGFRRATFAPGAPFRRERTSPRNNAIQGEQPPMYDMNNIKKLARIEADAPDAMRGFEAFAVAVFKRGRHSEEVQGTDGTRRCADDAMPLSPRDSQRCGHQRERHERRVGRDYRMGLARRCCHYARYAPDGGKLTAPRRGHLGLKKDPSRMAH